MSINWVIRKEGKAEPTELPDEQFVFSRDSISVTITSPELKIQATDMKLYLSYHRLVLLCKEPTTYRVPGTARDARFEDISIPLGKIKDMALYQPWIGPNGVKTLFIPIQNGGLPDNIYTAIIKFTSGGTFDFYEKYGQTHQGEALPAYSAEP